MKRVITLAALWAAIGGCSRAGFSISPPDLMPGDVTSLDSETRAGDGAGIGDWSAEGDIAPLADWSAEGDIAALADSLADSGSDSAPWAPDFYVSFEGGVIGAEAVGPDAASYTSPSNPTVWSDEAAYEGSMSGKATVGVGETGWGARIFTPLASRQATEIWYRVFSYYPSAFSFACAGCTEGISFLRLGFRDADTSDGLGAWSAGLNQDGRINVACSIARDGVQQAFYAQYPWQSGGVYDNRALGPAMVREVWTYHELYLRLSTQADGIIRVWKDGALIFENTAVQTMATGLNAENNIAVIFEGWSVGAPQDQHAFVDSIAYSTRTPPNRDAAGNRMIGDWIP